MDPRELAELLNGPAEVQTLSVQSLPQHLLANDLDISSLQTNALLRKDEWELLDERLQGIFEQTLNGIMDLQSRGLTLDLGGMGTILSQYEQVSDMDDAEVHMDAGVPNEQDRVQYNLVSVPVPVISKGFNFNIRHLASSRRLGQALDTTQSDRASRKVAEQLENILFNGNTSVMGGNPIYGYLNHPQRNTYTGSDWGTPTNIYGDILAAITTLPDGANGPYMLYLHRDQYIETLEISDTTRVRSELQVAVDSIPELEGIKQSSKVPAGQAALVNLTRDTAELAVGVDVQPVEWESMGGLGVHFKILMVAVPRIKSDYGNQSGVVHITGI